MATFTVTRVKKYTAEVEADSAKEARELALDLSPKDWKFLEDDIGDVIGLDKAVQHAERT